ncbi:hypothetical protein A0K93_06800 [Corynebacterium sp. BCW_4722]|nr:hypothetical protein A0K93_06800 [Corynebacterium sp. BCW_4722]
MQRKDAAMKLRRLMTALATATALAGVAMSPATSPVAHAAPNGNVVTFGDSYTSNPDEVRNTLKKSQVPQIRHFVWGTYPSKNGCLQSPDNWPRQLSRIANVPVSDHSCTAESSHVMPGRVDRAIAQGDIHPGTRAVVFAVGINDYGPYGINRGAKPLDQPRMHREYVSNMTTAVNKVRAVAPRAKIIFSGMLSVSEPYGLQSVCLVNVIPNLRTGIPLPGLQAIENHVRNHQRAAAHATRSTYVELKAPSAAHNTCAPDAQRWVAGAIDTTTQHTMGLHPTVPGSRFMAEQIARSL